MGDACLNESVASPGLKTAPGESVSIRKPPRVFSYKLALLATDMAAALGAAVIGTWIVGHGAIDGMDALQQIFFTALCLTPIAFFHNFHLYSYHLIYFPRRHLMQLAKACGLGLFSILIMTLTFKWPEFMPADLFVPCVAAFALAVLLINRFLINRFMEDRIAVLLKALGLALFVVGLIGILEPPEEAVMPQHLHEAFLGCLLAVFALAVVRCLVVHLLFNVVLLPAQA